MISTHALREEGDSTVPKELAETADFYPRPPRGGRRICSENGLDYGNFYPRPPRGGRPAWSGTSGSGINFYPRPPRGGRHRPANKPDKPGRNFYPRPPRGGRLEHFGQQRDRQPISTHALREEGDSLRMSWPPLARYFYPRPPRGGRRGWNVGTIADYMDFYPRPPRGGRRSWL